MSKREVYCEHCLRKIRSGDEFVTATSFFFVKAYCDSCYTNRIKGMSSFFISNRPLNGSYSNFFLIFLFIATIAMFFINAPIKWGFLIGLLWSGIYRLYSYYQFERHLK